MISELNSQDNVFGYYLEAQPKSWDSPQHTWDKLLPPVDLCLIFEKSSCKNQVRQTGFLQATETEKIQFEIDLKSG